MAGELSVRLKNEGGISPLEALWMAIPVSGDTMYLIPYWLE